MKHTAIPLTIFFILFQGIAFPQNSVSREFSVDNSDTLGIRVYANVFGKTESQSFDSDILKSVISQCEKAAIVPIVGVGPIPPRIPCLTIFVNVFSTQLEDKSYSLSYGGSISFQREVMVEKGKQSFPVTVPVFYETIYGNEDSIFPVLEEINKQVGNFLLRYLAANRK